MGREPRRVCLAPGRYLCRPRRRSSCVRTRRSCCTRYSWCARHGCCADGQPACAGRGAVAVALDAAEEVGGVVCACCACKDSYHVLAFLFAGAGGMAVDGARSADAEPGGEREVALLTLVHGLLDELVAQGREGAERGGVLLGRCSFSCLCGFGCGRIMGPRHRYVETSGRVPTPLKANGAAGAESGYKNTLRPSTLRLLII